MCDSHIFSKPIYSVDNKHLCYECGQRIIDGLNNKEQETPYAHCKDCGKEFSGIVTPYPNEDSDYCYMCYWRMLAKGNERQDRYACSECNQTFFTAEPNWFEGKRYCFDCFSKIKLERDRTFREEMFGRYRQQQYRSYRFNFGDFTNEKFHISSLAIHEAFALLGLAPGATVQEIKKAFKAKALVTHPDLGGKHTDMVALNKAKETCLEYAQASKR
jgi:hypothetical protein